MSEAVAYAYDRSAPRKYTDPTELIDEICERLAVGESLASIVRDPSMPGWGTVYAWRDADTETAERFQRAREVGEETTASRLKLVASGDARASSGDVQRDKLIIDTEFKLLAKMNPRKWGESTQLRHADADGAKLDNSGLVSELLTLMGPTPKAPAVRAELIDAPKAPRPAYRPRARAENVDDLV